MERMRGTRVVGVLCTRGGKNVEKELLRQHLLAAKIQIARKKLLHLNNIYKWVNRSYWMGRAFLTPNP
jgi:hypothetical protein